MAYLPTQYRDPLYETLTIGPPFKGIEQPFAGIYNPLDQMGHSSTCNHWFIHSGDVLRLSDGWAEQGTDLATDGRIKMIASYKSATKNDLIFVAGTKLSYYDLNTPASARVNVATILAVDTATRISWVRFRNRFLIATMADGLWWYNPETRTARKCGVAAPTAVTAAAGAAGVLTGTYACYVSYVNDQNHESNLSPVTSVVVAAQKIAWSGIPTGPTGTSSRKLYRSTAGNTTGLLLTTIADNVTTTFTDNLADTTLGATNDGNFTVPQTSIRNIAIQGNRVYLIDGSDGITLWASKVDSATGLPNFEAYPSSLSLQFPFVGGSDVAKAVTPIGQSLFIWGDLGGFRSLGDVAVGGVYTETLPWGIGLFSPQAWAMTPLGLFFIDNQRKFRLFDGAGMPKEVGQTLWKQLDTALSTCGLDGPDMTYDQLHGCVYVNIGTSTFNSKTLVFYLDSKEGTTTDWAFDVGYYSPTDRLVYYSLAGTKIYVTSQTDFRANGSNASNQKVEFLPITPVPGDKSYFIRLTLVVKAQPILSGVLPMLKVEYSLNDGAYFETKYLDVSKDYLVYSAGESSVKRVIEVPLYKRAESITIRISPAINLASVQNGQEIYSMNLHWQPSAEAKMKGRIAGSSPHVQTS